MPVELVIVRPEPEPKILVLGGHWKYFWQPGFTGCIPARRGKYFLLHLFTE